MPCSRGGGLGALHPGDPLSDAALMCVYRDPALDLIVHAQAAWTSPLLPAADELADRYSLSPGSR